MVLSLSSLFLLICKYIALVGALNDEGLALLSFKQSLENQAASYLINWNSSDVNPCSWHGVTCSSEEKVVSLSIPNDQLTGVLPPALGKLPLLRHVNLRNNKFFGSLPVQLFDAKGLQSLVLSGNSFSGPVPPEIANLKYLQTLDLSQNSFNGSIPSLLLQCKRLKMLVLSHNSFSGSLPDGFGSNLISLQKLDLSFNSLTDSIPVDFGNLSSLKGTLDLSHNFFNGPIPSSLGSLPERVYIDLSYNKLTGPIPQNDALVNLGPTAFKGNPFLCGFPLKISCPSTIPDPNSQSLINPSQVSVSSSDKGRKRSHLSSCTVIATVAGAMVGICLFGFLFSYWFKKSSGCKQVENFGGCRFEEKLMIRKEFFCFMKKDLDTLSENMEQYSFVPLDTKVDFDLDKLLKASAFLLGKSGFGIVYKAVLENRLTVAVRRLEDGWQRFKEFQTEVEAIGKVRHPNIVSLRAYCWSVDEKLLIYDYIPNGDLATAIHGKAGNMPFKPLSWPVRLRIMKGIAGGLAFLHEFSPKRYVHGDLKPSNILLGENMEPQISDFGLGRLANISEEVIHSERMAIATPPQSSPYEFTAINSAVSSSHYQSPEVSKVTKPSQKWDVYSYGVILLEMISGKLPIIQIGPLEMDLVQWIQVSIEERKPLSCIIDPLLRHDMEMEKDIAAIVKISLACVCKSPDRRPSMRYVSDILDKLNSQ